MNRRSLLFALICIVFIISYFYDYLHHFVYTYREYFEDTDQSYDESIDSIKDMIDDNDNIMHDLIRDYKEIEEIDVDKLTNYDSNIEIIDRIEMDIIPESQTILNSREHVMNNLREYYVDEINELKNDIMDFDDQIIVHV